MPENIEFTTEIKDRLLAGELLKEISELFGKTERWARVTFYRGKQKLLEKMEGDLS